MDKLQNINPNFHDVKNERSDEIPNVTYTDDCNILNLHKMVLSKLKTSVKTELQVLKEEYRTEVEKVKMKQSRIDRNFSLSQINKLQKQIVQMESSLSIENYLKESEETLNSYKQLGPLRKIISFGNATNPSTTPKISTPNVTDSEYRHDLIENYLQIANKYIKLNIVKSNAGMNFCKECKSDLTKNMISSDDGITRCKICSTEYVTMMNGMEDSEVTSSTNPSSYEDRKTFIKAIMHYQGKQPNRLEGLEVKLDKYFNVIGLPSGEEIRSLPLNKDGTRGKTGRELLFLALKELGLSAFYEDDWLICHEYWGWKLPEISHLEEVIVIDYDISQGIYEKYKGVRKSNMNNQYRLWRHLDRLGHDCLPDDFRIVRTQEILDFYEKVWVQICSDLGWSAPKPISTYSRRLNFNFE